MSLAIAAGAAAGVAAASAYLDAKLHLSKDLNRQRRATRAQRNFDLAVQKKEASTIFLFEKVVQQHPEAVCIWSRQGVYTWAQTYERVCQYGHYFKHELGVKPFDFVGLYMYNCPEFLFIWMGLMSIGAAPALINYNLASEALLHCVRQSGTGFLMYDAAHDCTTRIDASQQQFQQLGIRLIQLNKVLKEHIACFPLVRAETDCFAKPHKKNLPFAIMYTSGTTGLPKAYAIDVSRAYAPASLFPKTFGQKPGPDGDRSYYCIPLYHGTCGFAAMGDLASGISMAIAPKFSTSRFWSDCIDSQSTIFVYVGELIRYLLSAPPATTDRQHKVRLIWGNGLSPELWTKVQERFGISEVGEFFASTEGVLTLYNYCRNSFGSGAIGHDGWLFRRQNFNNYIPVQVDYDTGEVWRSPETGFARRVPYEEGGEVLVRLASRAAWSGYWRSDEATAKKIMEDVFEKGDLFYRTGDALRRNSDGHWYFLDRLGDTYRWKGENVSTTEVCQVLGSHPQIAEPNVYGVKIPSHEGRAGCAALSLKTTPEEFDWAELAGTLRSELPAYAVPIFIRVLAATGLMATGNFKQIKGPLRQEGVDPGAMGTKFTDGKDDRLYWLPAGSAKYVPFTAEDWDSVSQLRVRL